MASLVAWEHNLERRLRTGLLPPGVPLSGVSDSLWFAPGLDCSLVLLFSTSYFKNIVQIFQLLSGKISSLQGFLPLLKSCGDF